MGSAAESVEDRYRRGDLDFEAAVREVTGTDVDRAFFARIVHGLAAASPLPGR